MPSFPPLNLLLSGVSLGVFMGLLLIFMFVRADVIFGEFETIAKNVLQTYIFVFIMFSIIGLAVAKRLPLFNVPVLDIAFFTIGAGMTFLFLFLIPKGIGQATVANLGQGSIATIGFGLLWAFVKAYVEEYSFRGVLPAIIGSRDRFGIISSLLFVGFHVGLLGVGFIGGTILFILGLIWYQVAQRLGLMASTGSHFMWNMFVLGVV